MYEGCDVRGSHKQGRRSPDPGEFFRWDQALQIPQGGFPPPSQMSEPRLTVATYFTGVKKNQQWGEGVGPEKGADRWTSSRRSVATYASVRADTHSASPGDPRSPKQPQRVRCVFPEVDCQEKERRFEVNFLTPSFEKKILCLHIYSTYGYYVFPKLVSCFQGERDETCFPWRHDILCKTLGVGANRGEQR